MADGKGFVDKFHRENGGGSCEGCGFFDAVGIVRADKAKETARQTMRRRLVLLFWRRFGRGARRGVAQAASGLSW